MVNMFKLGRHSCSEGSMNIAIYELHMVMGTQYRIRRKSTCLCFDCDSAHKYDLNWCVGLCLYLSENVTLHACEDRHQDPKLSPSWLMFMRM